MDGATNEHYSMFFVAEEVTASSLRGVQEVLRNAGYFRPSNIFFERVQMSYSRH